MGPRAGPDGRKISLPPGFDPPTVQPVASRYIDYATRPTTAYKRDAMVENNFCLRFSLHCILGFLAGKYDRVHRQGEHMKTHNHAQEKDKHCYCKKKKNSRSERNGLVSGGIVFIQGNKKIQLRGKTFSETLRNGSLIYFSRPRKQKQGF